MSHSGIVSEASTRASSIDLSYSDIDSSHLGMDMDPANAAPELKQDPAKVPQEQETRKDTAIERDPIYFCENVVLMVEDRIFSVPKGGLLDNGTYFQSLFSPQIPNDADSGRLAAGSSEQHPIVLRGVSKVHFHNFLRVVYPFQGIGAPSGDDHWLGILDLATKWGFQETRETALRHLEHIFTPNSPHHDPIHALFLCQKFNIQKYIKQQFEALIISITPLDHATMLARGIDTETVLLLMHLRDKWTCGMLWRDKGLGNGASDIFPRRLSARKIIEDHFSGLGPRPASQEEKDRDADWKQDEARRLDDEVRRMEEAEKVECGVQGDAEGLNEKEEARDNESTSEEPESPCGEDLLDDTCSDSSESDVDVPADAEARIGKLILLHSDKHRMATLIENLKLKGVDEANPRLQALMDVAEKCEQRLCEYWGKVTGLSLNSVVDIAKNVEIDLTMVGDDEQSSRQAVEQAIQNLLYPSAKSLGFSIYTGIGGYRTPVMIQSSMIGDIVKQFCLGGHTYDGRASSSSTSIPHHYEIYLPKSAFGKWLETFRSRYPLDYGVPFDFELIQYL